MNDLLARLRDPDNTRRIGESYADTHERRQRDREEAADRIEQLEDALREILSNSCDAFYEMANMLDDEDFSGEVPGRSGTLIGHREEYHKYMVEALTKAGDAAREALTAMEQRT